MLQSASISFFKKDLQIVSSILKTVKILKDRPEHRTHECLVCQDRFFPDLGIFCTPAVAATAAVQLKSHFYCKTCFESGVPMQLAKLAAQDGEIVCFEVKCRAVVPMKEISSKVSKECLKTIQEAQIDVRVAVHEKAFENKLKEEAAKLYAQYAAGDHEFAVKERITQAAMTAREELLNLRCPNEHCKAPYA